MILVVWVLPLSLLLRRVFVCLLCSSFRTATWQNVVALAPMHTYLPPCLSLPPPRSCCLYYPAGTVAAATAVGVEKAAAMGQTPGAANSLPSAPTLPHHATPNSRAAAGGAKATTTTAAVGGCQEESSREAAGVAAATAAAATGAAAGQGGSSALVANGRSLVPSPPVGPAAFASPAAPSALVPQPLGQKVRRSGACRLTHVFRIGCGLLMSPSLYSSATGCSGWCTAVLLCFCLPGVFRLKLKPQQSARGCMWHEGRFCFGAREMLYEHMNVHRVVSGECKGSTASPPGVCECERVIGWLFWSRLLPLFVFVPHWWCTRARRHIVTPATFRRCRASVSS